MASNSLKVSSVISIQEETEYDDLRQIKNSLSNLLDIGIASTIDAVIERDEISLSQKLEFLDQVISYVGRKRNQISNFDLSGFEKFADREDRKESPFRFIERVYGEVLCDDFHLGIIRHYDEQLYMAYFDRRRRYGEPEGFHINTIDEYLDGKVSSLLGDGLFVTGRRELRRIGSAMHRRLSEKESETHDASDLDLN